MMARWERILRFVLAAVLAFVLAPALHAQDDPPLVYRVQAGDTLYALADRYLDGRNVVARVQSLNRVANPRRLKIGSTLRIPRELARYEDISLRVRKFSGPVRIAGRAASVGSLLAEGTEVQTGANGFVSFGGADGSLITIPSSSRARLVRARRYFLGQTLDVDFAVLGGRGAIQAPKLRDQERFRVRTPLAVTAVRGTEFRVAHDADASVSITEVVEGTVTVASGDSSDLTDAGFGIASSPTGLGAKEALLPPPTLDKPGAIQTDPQVIFVADLPAGSTAYRTQIARDAGFVDIIAESIDNAAAATFENIENGRYFVRARAISAQGIEGKSTEANTFRRKRLGVAPSVAPSPLADGFLFAWLQEGEGKSYYAFQLWPAGRNESLLVDEVGLDGSGMVLSGLDQGAYEWRVAVMQADPEDGLIKVWAPVQKLTVSD